MGVGEATRAKDALHPIPVVLQCRYTMAAVPGKRVKQPGRFARSALQYGTKAKLAKGPTENVQKLVVSCSSSREQGCRDPGVRDLNTLEEIYGAYVSVEPV